MRIEKTEQLASSSKLPPEQAYETAVALYNQYHKQDRIFKELKDFTEYKSFKENQEIKEYKDLHKLWPGLTKDNGQASAEIKKIVVYFMRSTDEASGISPAIPIKACYFIGMYFQKIACFYDAFYYFKMAANLGDPLALFYMAICHQTGGDVQRDDKLAFSYFSQAADKDIVEAELKMAECYSSDCDISLKEKEEKEEKEAVEKEERFYQLFDKLAQQKNPYGYICVGRCFLDGVHVSQDAQTAVQWFTKAATECNSALGKVWLGRCSLEGNGIAADATIAFAWFQQAAEQNCKEGEYWFAKCNMEGKGTSVNKEVAIKWYQQAAGNGDSRAAFDLGMHYYHEENKQSDTLWPSISLGKQSSGHVIDWLKKAAHLGHPEAQFYCGSYFQQIGVLTLVNMYFRKAASQGHTRALYQMGLYSQTGL